MADPSKFESVADRLIREAMDRGEFEALPGAGKPLPDSGKPYDPAWWVRRWVRWQSEEVDADGPSSEAS